MTIEEAGQRILEGEVWMKCKACGGIGETHTGDDEMGYEGCDACRSQGIFLDPTYAKACKVLKMKKPKLPSDPGELAELQGVFDD